MSLSSLVRFSIFFQFALAAAVVAALAAPSIAQEKGKGSNSASPKTLRLEGDGATPAKTPKLFRPVDAGQPAATKAKPALKAIELPEGDSADLEDAWNDHFAKHREEPATVRETVRQLMKQREFSQISALIRGAIRNGQIQPWMYESLGLAMQLNEDSQEEIERALMSAVDFAATPDELLNIAQYMARIGLNARALSIYRQASTLQPLRPEPYAFGLQLAKRLNDDEAIRWACVGILSQAWPADQADIEADALRVANATLDELRKQKKIKEAQAFEAALNAAIVRDCVVRVSWDSEADVDIMVQEPSGTVCSLRSPRTVSGGALLGDRQAAQLGEDRIGTRSEIYVCPKAFSGEYKVLIRRVWGNLTAGKVTVDVYTNYRSKKPTHERQHIPLGEKDALVTFTVDQGRRTEPLKEEQLAQAARNQVDVGRAVLMQQLAQSIDPAVLARLAASRNGTPFQNIPGLGAGAVGYQPVIITLPEGVNFAVSGVISADRRYVRITALPLFSLIGDVDTFTFFGGMGDNAGGDLDGGM